MKSKSILAGMIVLFIIPSSTLTGTIIGRSNIKKPPAALVLAGILRYRVYLLSKACYKKTCHKGLGFSSSSGLGPVLFRLVGGNYVF